MAPPVFISYYKPEVKNSGLSSIWSIAHSPHWSSADVGSGFLPEYEFHVHWGTNSV